MKRSFQLSPFPGQTSSPWESFSLNTALERLDQRLTLTFELTGPLSDLSLSTSKPTPSRQHDLWEHTCFEMFLSEPTSPVYWEVNLSPIGDWNIYRFSSYRTGMVEEKRIQNLTSQREQHPNHFWLSCPLPLNTLALDSKGLEINVTAVLENRMGDLSYWAITHANHQPDFHHRQSFTVQI